jgi:hypothetical protein
MRLVVNPLMRAWLLSSLQSGVETWEAIADWCADKKRAIAAAAADEEVSRRNSPCYLHLTSHKTEASREQKVAHVSARKKQLIFTRPKINTWPWRD